MSGTRHAPQRGGAGKCVTCSHPQLTEIDADLAAGGSIRQLAKRYGISTTSLQRHKQRHLGRELVKLEPMKESPKLALARADKVYQGLNQDWDAARQAGQTGVVLAISKELRPAIELGAKLSGELNERPQHLTLNLLANDQFMEIVKVILEELGDAPEVKERLVRRLRVLNKDEKAS